MKGICCRTLQTRWFNADFLLLAFVLKINNGDDPKEAVNNVIMHAHTACFVVRSGTELYFMLCLNMEYGGG
jgi:hypothetical protein